LNKLAENPERVEAAIKGIALGIGAIAAVRVGAGIVSFIASLNSLKSGGGLNMDGLENAGGGAGIPVHVTNWGGSDGSSMMPKIPGLPKTALPKTALPKVLPKVLPKAGGLLSLLSKAGPVAAFIGGTIALSQLIDKWGTAGFTMDGKHYREWSDQAQAAAQSGDKESEREATIAALKIQIPEYERLRASFGPEEKFLHYDAAGGSRMVTLDELRGELRTLLAGADLKGSSAALPSETRGSPGVPPTNYSVGLNQRKVNDLIVTPQGQFSTHPDDYILAMKNPMSLVNNSIRNEVRVGAAVGSVVPILGTAVGALVGAGIGALGMWAGSKAGRAIGTGIGEAAANDDTERRNIAPGRRRRYNQSRHPANDSSAMSQDVAPQNQYTQAVNKYMQDAVRSVERIPPAIPPVKIDGAIELKSELFIDDKGYRLQQQVVKNTTPYKFATGNVTNARLIQ